MRKKNFCRDCEEIVTFVKGRCKYCKGTYDEVVPASYREEYKWYLEQEKKN